MFANGVLDKGYCNNLTDQEAYDFGQRTIYHATFRGVHMKDDGYNIMSETDCMKLHYKFTEEKTGLTAWFEKHTFWSFKFPINLRR